MKHNQLPPQDLEAERSVIGGMMVYGDDGATATDEAMSLVAPEHFYTEAHQAMFAVVRDMRTTGKAVDGVTMGHELASRKQLELIGGPAYIVQCLEAVPHAAHTGYYARIVREKADRRMVIQHATEMLKVAYDPGLETDEALATVEQSLTTLSESRARGNRTVDLMTVLMDSLVNIEAGTKRGLQTGFGKLDELTTGIHNGQLIVIAARPSIGKSSFATCVAYQMSVAVPTLYFSLEMSNAELAERLLSLESGVSFYKMRKGDLTANDHEMLNMGRNGLFDKQIIIDDETDRTVANLASVARLQRRKRNIGLVIIDYLQLLVAADRRTPREQQVAEMTRSLKCLAKSLNIPVVVLAQLNRDIESRGAKEKTPRLADLRESGAIEQDADQVWMLHRPCFYLDATDAKYDESQAELYVRKNRSGPTGRVDFEFVKELMRFREGFGHRSEF